MKSSISKSMLFITSITFFLDFVGLFMVNPIFSPLFLDSNSSLLPTDASHLVRTFIIGLLTASYGFGQLFGGPILGEISDQYGRKKILLLGLSTLVIGNILGAVSLTINSLVLLFICRFLTGFASGNGAVLFATISDMSPNDTERGINLGYLTGSATLGVVAGPLIGARLSDPNTFFLFNLSTPFWFMVIAIIINIFLIFLFFENPLSEYQPRKLNFLTGFKNIIACVKMPTIQILLLTYFLFVFSTESLFVSLPIMAVEKFHVDRLFLGDLFATGAIASAFSSIYLNKKLSKKFSSFTLFFASLIILSIVYVLLILPNHAIDLFPIYFLFGFAAVLAWTHGNSMIVGQANANDKGKVLGVTQSLLSLAIILGPTFVGLLAALHHNIAIMLSEIAVLSSLFIFSSFWLRKKNTSTSTLSNR